jgi:hypothetical protein
VSVYDEIRTQHSAVVAANWDMPQLLATARIEARAVAGSYTRRGALVYLAALCIAAIEALDREGKP